MKFFFEEEEGLTLIIIIHNKYSSDSIFIYIHTYINIIGRAKQAPHCGVQSRFRVIYIYVCVCVSVCLSYPKMHRQNYVAQTRACSKSDLGG